MTREQSSLAIMIGVAICGCAGMALMIFGQPPASDYAWIFIFLSTFGLGVLFARAT